MYIHALYCICNLHSAAQAILLEFYSCISLYNSSHLCPTPLSYAYTHATIIQISQILPQIIARTNTVVTPLERKCIARIQIYLHATLRTRPFINYSSLLFPGSCHDIVQCLVPKLSQLVVRFQYQHRTKSRSNHISRTCVTSNLYERL